MKMLDKEWYNNIVFFLLIKPQAFANKVILLYIDQEKQYINSTLI